MRPICSAAALAAALAGTFLVPAVTRAQVSYGSPTALAFTSPTQTYNVSGCGSGPLSYVPGAPEVRVFCLAGTATLGVATTAAGANIYQAVLDFTGTRIGGFDGRFFFFNEPYLDLDVRQNGVGGPGMAAYMGFGTPTDPTGHWTTAYEFFLGAPIEVFGVSAGGVTLGPDGEAVLEYVPSDAPGGGADYGRSLRFALTITETPEPATLALMLGGLAVLGAGAWRRRA